MSANHLSAAGNRVIRTPAKPAVRSHVCIVSTNGRRARHLQAVLLRGHFSASVAEPEELVATAKVGDTPNVIVLDMTDPDFDALAVCRILRASDVQSAILMVHPQGNLDDLLDGYEAGTDAYLMGHVDHTELFHRIDDLSWPQRASA